MRPVVLLLFALAGAATPPLHAQAPTGLAASALADSVLRWVPREAPGIRAYFLADSYPARHQDSLLARLRPAIIHAEGLIGAPPLTAPMDVFFVETRDHMARVIRGRATGFAQPSARAVFLVTNPSWRAFERHEIMHVIAWQAWGPPGPNTDWLVEGLAQAADGACAGYANADVLLVLTARQGWIPLETLLTDFRNQPDLRAYLQAAAFVDYLLGRVRAPALRQLWQGGAEPGSIVAGHTLDALAREWRAGLVPAAHPSPEAMARVEGDGCG